MIQRYSLQAIESIDRFALSYSDATKNHDENLKCFPFGYHRE